MCAMQSKVRSIPASWLICCLSAALQYHDHEPAPGPLDLQVFDGADHFFAGRYEVRLTQDIVNKLPALKPDNSRAMLSALAHLASSKVSQLHMTSPSYVPSL